MGDVIGYVLSGASTHAFSFELTELGEQVVEEGMLVAVRCRHGQVVGRVDALKFYSDTYKPGDLWSAARREGFRPPDLARYSVAEATVLGVLGGGLEDPRRPPEPGDAVEYLESTPEILEKLYGVAPGSPGVVWYGSLLGYEDLPLALDVEALTMHLGVFGETGSGKSYGFGYLLELLASIPVSGGLKAALPAIIVDANGDYLDYWHAYVRGCKVGSYRRVLRLVYGNSPCRYMPSVRVISLDLDWFTTRELAEFIVAYKYGGRDLNELQVAALERVLRELREEGYSFTEVFTSRPRALEEKLQELSGGRGAVIHYQTARAVQAAVDKFRRDVVEAYGLVSKNPTLSEKSLLDAVEGPDLVVVDFSAEGAPGVPLPVKQLVVAYLARLLYSLFTRLKMRGEERYVLFAMEEAQNYAPNPRSYPLGWSLARDYLALIATQGRKFGICLAIISQRPAFVDQVVVSMLNTMIVHRLSPDDVVFVSKVVGGLPAPLEQKLTRLPRGYALVLGQANMLRRPVVVKVGRRSFEHAVGRTKLVETLAKLAARRFKEGGGSAHGLQSSAPARRGA